MISIQAQAQWAAEPGTTVRNAFGPNSGMAANICRGACGGGCPATCARTVAFECAGSASLARVVTYECGTHAACRLHDNCLDACVSDDSGRSSQECQFQCDADVVDSFGAQSAATWLLGQGPYDGLSRFEYSREAPDSLEAAYRCPRGTSRQCEGAVGCVASNGQIYEPVFASYPQAASNTMQVAAVTPGLVCEDHVCTYATEIPISGADDCGGQRCTRYGIEFDYENANPASPLECTTSTTGEEDGDFVNTLLKQGADVLTSRSGQNDHTEEPEPEQGARELISLFGKILASGKSTEDVNISITPLDKDGNPVESKRVGSNVEERLPPVPSSVMLPAKRGHLFIPMYQSSSGMASGQVKDKHLVCSHQGQPVLEANFRLRGV